MKTPALILNEVNLRYFTGVSNPSGCLLITEKETYWLTYDVENAQRGCVKNIIRTSDIMHDLFAMLKKMKIKTVNTPINEMSALQYESLKKAVKVIDSSAEIKEIRMTKTKEEISKIKKACSLADRAMKAAKESIKVGVTERKVRSEILDSVLEECEDQAFSAIVASGTNSYFTHAFPSDKRIQEHETIIVDLGFSYEGYCSDLTRTFAINPTKEQEKLYKTVFTAQEAAFKKLKAGKNFSDSYNAVDAYFKKAGVKKFWKYSLGHGIGINVHEEPKINAKAKEKIGNNMTFTIEPGLHIPGIGGARVEDTMLFDKKPIFLTKSPKEFAL